MRSSTPCRRITRPSASRKKSRPEAMAAAPRPTIAGLIAEGERELADAGIGPARLEAEVLLARSLGVSRAALILEPGAAVASGAAGVYRADVAKRATRYPLQYITVLQEFHSLDFEVDERVLVPRPETEMIVDEVLRLCCVARGAAAGRAEPATGRLVAGDRNAAVRPHGGEPGRGVAAAPLIVDVGTGSGCIAVTLAVRLPLCRLFASDVSEDALEIAARNALRHGVADHIQFAQGDGLAPALEAGLTGRADFVVSNPPYVPEAELEGLQAELAHEPRGALTPGPDGLSFTARLVEEAARIVRPGGHLLIELGAGSAERALRLCDPVRWTGVRVEADAQGFPRLLVV